MDQAKRGREQAANNVVESLGVVAFLREVMFRRHGSSPDLVQKGFKRFSLGKLS